MIMNCIEYDEGFADPLDFAGNDPTDEKFDELFRRKKSNSRKNLIALFVYKILTEETDRNKHVSQKELAKRLEEYPYEIKIERKALARCVHNLEDEGLGIRSDKRYGCWFDKDRIWA